MDDSGFAGGKGTTHAMSMAHGSGSIALEHIRSLATHWPNISLEDRGTVITITPDVPDGFPITLYDKGDDCMVTAERWHAHYDDPIQAAYCAAWLLTPFYRVAHELKGGILAAVWIERYEIDEWQGMEPVFFLNPDYPPDWELAEGARFMRRYFQQAIIPPPVALEKIHDHWILENQLPPNTQLGISHSESVTSIALLLATPTQED